MCAADHSAMNIMHSMIAVWEKATTKADRIAAAIDLFKFMSEPDSLTFIFKHPKFNAEIVKKCYKVKVLEPNNEPLVLAANKLLRALWKPIDPPQDIMKKFLEEKTKTEVLKSIASPACVSLFRIVAKRMGMPIRDETFIENFRVFARNHIHTSTGKIPVSATALMMEYINEFLNEDIKRKNLMMGIFRKYNLVFTHDVMELYKDWLMKKQLGEATQKTAQKRQSRYAKMSAFALEMTGLFSVF